MANIIIKNLNGMMFETDESNFRNYEPYGSTLATQSEWEEYCHPNVVATVEAEKAPKTDEVVPTPAVEEVPSPEVKFAPEPTPVEEAKPEIKFAPEPVLDEVKTEEVTEPTPVEDVKTETKDETPVTTDETPKEKALSKMNRAELVAKLLELNPHFPAIEDATVDEIRTEIKQALIEQA